MQIMTTILEIFAPILAVLATIVLPLVVTRLLDKWGIEVEEKNRQALQSALRNAAMVAVSKAVPSIGNNMANVAVDTAVGYVQDSVPDAIRKFGLNRARITELLEPHIQNAINDKKTRL